MRSKSFIAVAAVLVVLGALAAGVYAYDSSREDLIAEGITLGGVDVGGLTAAEARDKLRSNLLNPLNRPVVARYKGRKFTLTPETARVGVNVDESVADAIARSRQGNIVTRTYRGLTGAEIQAAMDVDITYDRAAVTALVERISERLEQPAVDADVNLEGGNVQPTPSKTGLAVSARALSRAVKRRLISINGTRSLRIPVERVEPEVTTEELADKYPAIVVVNRGAFTLQLYKDLKAAKSYRIAVGQAGLETPQGRYNIQNKQVNPYWNVPESDWAGDLAGTVVPPGPSNPLKSRWMGIYNGAGIHGTDAIGSLGTAASHGCIRMAVPDVEDLYDQVDVGTPVYIL